MGVKYVLLAWCYLTTDQTVTQSATIARRRHHRSRASYLEIGGESGAARGQLSRHKVLSVDVSADPTQIVGINVEQPSSKSDQHLRGEPDREKEQCLPARRRSRN